MLIHNPCLYTFDTSIVGIYDKTLRTEFTYCFVVLHFAGGVIWTGYIIAGVLALEVDAGLMRRAASIF